MADDDQLHRADDVDRVISAEIPNKNDDAALYEIILRNNVHGPCGEHLPSCDARCRDQNPKCPCMKSDSPNGQKFCSKKFPKAFQVKFLFCLELFNLKSFRKLRASPRMDI